MILQYVMHKLSAIIFLDFSMGPVKELQKRESVPKTMPKRQLLDPQSHLCHMYIWESKLESGELQVFKPFFLEKVERATPCSIHLPIVVVL